MKHSCALKLVLGIVAVTLGYLISSAAWAVPLACIPGHHTVVPPCTFDVGVLSIDSATGPNGTDVFTGGGGGGHHTLVTFPVNPLLGPGIQVAADIAAGNPPYMASDSPTGTSSGSITVTISTVSGLPLIHDFSFALLNPFVAGPGSSISWSVTDSVLGTILSGNQFLTSGTFVFPTLVSSITETLSGTLRCADPFCLAGRAQIDGFVTNISLASVPEPASVLLLASGLVGLAGWRWWKKG